MYNGEVNVENLDNWIRQIEVYCRLQRIKDDETKIQLASLILESATLIWWEAKTQEDMKKHGKVLSSWNDFIVALKRQFYPLAYTQKVIMDWQNFRQARKKLLWIGKTLDKPKGKVCKPTLKNLEEEL
jgi:hypothetical protein